MNAFTGTLPSTIGQLRNVKELMLSRTSIRGTIPNALGELTNIENLEMYGNMLTGSIPSSLGRCSGLKRIGKFFSSIMPVAVKKRCKCSYGDAFVLDLFNNKLNGTIPESISRLQSLQILHVKLNQLTGTIPSMFGELPHLSWFDLSSNNLHGTIPATFGSSFSIKDFRLGGNMIYEPIPAALCSNTNINGGLTRIYGCDGVICPLGTFSDPGHATHSDGCKPCPEGMTTMYLGSSSCEKFTEADILSIFFDAMGGNSWNALQRNRWKDYDYNVCKWHGIGCDSDNNSQIESIRFPLIGVEDFLL